MRFPRLPSRAACALAALALVIHSAFAGTVINVSSSTQVAGVRRFGINAETASYFDSRQMLKDFAFIRNGNFEGQIYQSIVRCGPGGTASSAIEDQSSTQWPSGFWDGATYEFVFGTAAGRSGTISHSLAPNRAQPPTDPLGSTQGTTYNFNDTDASKIPANGDCMILRKSEVGDGTAGGAATINWSTGASGGGTITSETGDLPPGTLGRQCVRLTATTSGQQASLSTSFDSTAGATFVSLNGAFQLSFKAKGVGGSNSINVQVKRGTGTAFINQTITLSASWSTYTLNFTGTENGTQSGGVALSFSPVNQSALLLDDVSLIQTNGDPANATVFRDSVLAALRSYNPGILRGLIEHYGDSLDNELAVPTARQRTGYSAFGTFQTVQAIGLHEFLTLCEAVGADPWCVTPAVFSPQEATNLMEYLGGATSTTYGAKRAALGHPAPWTGVFTRIHLEFGNENWNAVFRGGTFSNAVAYGTRGDVIFGAVKSSPYYNSAQFDLVLGSQSVNPGLTLQIHNASTNHDSMTLAPYMNSKVDTFATNEDYYGPLFAEPEWWSRVPTGTSGFMRGNYNNIQGSSRPVPLSVYEVNINTTQGAITQTALDNFVPSAGSALAVADHMLLMLHDLSMRDQVMFSLGGYRANRGDGKSVALWGTVRDMGVTDRKRPQFLALQMANQALSGDMVATTHSGDDPTWNQPLTNLVSYTGAHYLQSYAFSNDSAKSLIVFNLHRTNSLDVNFTGPNAPAGTITRNVLTSANLTDNNESAQNVATVTDTLTSFDPNATLTLPPFSMTLLKWTQPAVDTWRYTFFGTTGNAGNAANTADPYHTGVPNLATFAILGPNQDPAKVATGLLPKPQIIGVNYVISFIQPAGVNGVTYGAQWCADLAVGNWQTVSDTGSGSTHTFSVPIAGNANIFMRLTVTSP